MQLHNKPDLDWGIRGLMVLLSWGAVAARSGEGNIDGCLLLLYSSKVRAQALSCWLHQQVMNDPVDFSHGDNLDFSKNIPDISEEGRFEIIVWGDRDSRKYFFSVFFSVVENVSFICLSLLCCLKRDCQMSRLEEEEPAFSFGLLLNPLLAKSNCTHDATG